MYNSTSVIVGGWKVLGNFDLFQNDPLKCMEKNVVSDRGLLKLKIVDRHCLGVHVLGREDFML